jgi:membrane fusion protein, heavy metal efflux system
MLSRKIVSALIVAVLVIGLASLAGWHYWPQLTSQGKAMVDRTSQEADKHNDHDEKDKKGHSKGEEGHDEHEGERLVKLSQKEIQEFGIKLAVVGEGKLKAHLGLTGEIAVDADRFAHVTPRLSGVVRQVNKTLGDQVSPGEVLAVIDSRELADAKANYLAAREKEALARAKFRREKDLWEKKITSEQEYLDAKQALAEASIMRRSTEQKLHALGLSDDFLRKLPYHPDQLLTRYEILAPIKGTIVKKHITLGEKVKGESEIFALADLDKVWAMLTVYQKDLARVALGNRVRVSATQGSAKSAGVIDYISPLVDETTRTATARVVLDNAKRIWRPGVFINGQVDTGAIEVKLLIPTSALQALDGETVVFIRTPEGFEPHHVKLGRRSDTMVEITEGLKPGQHVVTQGAFTLKADLGKGSFGDGHGH